MPDVLVLCTANVCRSPMAQGFLTAELASRGVGGTVRSAGTDVGPERPPADAVAAMAAWGIDTSGHRARALDDGLLESADLVLGMTRKHAREAVVRVPAVFPRAFTLKELVRRATAVGPRSAGQPFAAWLAAVGEGRSRGALVGRSAGDDVADPIGGPPEVYRATAAELHDLVVALCDLAWPTRED
ncbi:MAG: low molecular weight phosphatase family protein [Actinomycetota bacterium]|nr:low molecular weight phosphatase family protein [Actinomycetota bacterium]